MEAALRSDLIRGYVRLYKTPPARVRLDNSAQEQARLLLLVLVQVRGVGGGGGEGREDGEDRARLLLLVLVQVRGRGEGQEEGSLSWEGRGQDRLLLQVRKGRWRRRGCGRGGSSDGVGRRGEVRPYSSQLL